MILSGAFRRMGTQQSTVLSQWRTPRAGVPMLNAAENTPVLGLSSQSHIEEHYGEQLRVISILLHLILQKKFM